MENNEGTLNVVLVVEDGIYRDKPYLKWIGKHCPFCGKSHGHAAGAVFKKKALRKELGHRLSHCQHDRGGYYLKWDGTVEDRRKCT